MPDSRSNDYHFATHWTVNGTCEEVSDLLANPLDLPRWWSAVYLKVDELRPPEPGDWGGACGC